MTIFKAEGLSSAAVEMAHMLYVRVRYGKWTHWQLLYPGQ
jgi:hypothetical protein